MAGRKKYEPTGKDIEKVVELKSKGASDEVCSKAIGISRYTFNKYKNTHFLQPIKEAAEIRSEILVSCYEDSMEKQIKGFFEDEIDYDYIGLNEDGTEEWLPTRKKRKYYPPNATLTMFKSVNLSNGKYQSINKVEVTQENNTTNELPIINWTMPTDANKIKS